MKLKPALDSLRGKKRIFLVEDHPIFREGITVAINNEAELSVCGFSDNAAKALSAIGDLKPDLAVIDITLPGRSGLELIKDLRAVSPETTLLVVSMHDELLFAERALAAGAKGYVMKDADTGTVIKAIRQALAGSVVVSQKISERILETFTGSRSRTPTTLVEQLTDREFGVLQLIGRGMDTPSIARQLHLSPKTVAVHKTRIKEKLKLKTATEVIRFALTCEESHRGSSSSSPVAGKRATRKQHG